LNNFLHKYILLGNRILELENATTRQTMKRKAADNNGYTPSGVQKVAIVAAFYYIYVG